MLIFCYIDNLPMTRHGVRDMGRYDELESAEQHNSIKGAHEFQLTESTVMCWQ